MTGGRFEGRVAIVTGAGRGMGAAQARRLASEGATVIVADIDDDAARDVASSLGSHGHAHVLDVADERGWSTIVTEVVAQHGGVSVLVNNAGVSQYQPLELIDSVEHARQVAVNQLGVFLGMKAVFDPMKRGGGGSIVNITSGAATNPVERMAVYSATKAAAWAMTRVAAREWGRYGVRVNAVQPGVIDTTMTAGVDGVDVAAMMAANPLPRMGRVEEVAAAVAFLASDDAAYITGISVMVDGGRSSAVPRTAKEFTTP